MKETLKRAHAFCERFGLRVPVLLAPMAGVSAPSLSIAVINAGGLGACGALLMKPSEIHAWADEIRASTSGPFQINLWVPDPPPKRDADQEARVREFLAQWGPPVPAEAGDAMRVFADVRDHQIAGYPTPGGSTHVAPAVPAAPPAE